LPKWNPTTATAPAMRAIYADEKHDNSDNGKLFEEFESDEIQEF
jgi:hypothetical protein